ncbi:Pentatricopeptide repeat-containing protein At2g41720 (Protein EMBRYO DEFECTIVE 2654) [Durusdinium trenchii]
MQLLISMPSLKALPDVISFSAAISSCEKGLQWPNAVALLDGMSLEAIHPNVISLNAVIGACSFDAWQWGLHLLNNMDSWKLMPDVISFNSAIAACGTAEKWDMALRLLHSMRHSPRPNSRTYNAAIAACERGSQWEQAFQVQELMKTRKVKVDIIGCGSLISACEKCKQWDQALSLLWRHSSHPQTGIANMVLRSVIEWQMALALLGLLIAEKLQTDTRSYTAVISACEASARWQEILMLLEHMGEQALTMDAVVHSLEISACFKGMEWGRVMHSLEVMRNKSLQPDLVNVNTVASAYQKATQWHLALAVMQQMQEDGLQADPITFASCILSLGRVHKWRQAMQLFDEMLFSKVEPGNTSCNAVLSACQTAQAWQSVLQIFLSMPELQVQADVVSYNVCIGSSGKGQQWEGALEILSQMLLERLEVTTISCNAAICACQFASHWQDAAHILSSMQLHGPEPDLTTFHACMPAFGRYQKWEVSLDMMADLQSSNQKLDLLTYSAAMCSCQNAQQWMLVLQLLSEMCSSQLLPDLLCWTAALDACGKSWQWQKSLGFLQDMRSQRLVPDTVCCNAVLGACRLQWRQAAEILSVMNAKGPRPDALSLETCSETCVACNQHCPAVTALNQMPFTALELLQGCHVPPKRRAAHALTFCLPAAAHITLPLGVCFCIVNAQVNSLSWPLATRRVSLSARKSREGITDAVEVRALVLFLPGILASLNGRKPVETARIYGNVNKYAYYFADLMVGTPPQLTSVIVDTGSHLLAFPCGGCGDKCGHHLEPAVDISKSSTAHWEHCDQVPEEQGRCKCSSDNRCKYSETYSEGSAITGHWFMDKARLGDSFENNTAVEVKMGCHDSENKLFYTQKANGIMGLAPILPAAWAPQEAARAPEILEDLFRHKQHIDSRVFALCLGNWGGMLAVGGPNHDYHHEGITWIGMSSLGYYVVHPSQFHVDSLVVAASSDEFGKAIIDSGTTLSYFPSQVFARLITNIETYCGTHESCHAGKDPTNSHCWRLNDPSASPEGFPTLHLKFDQGAEVVSWEPASYLSERGYGVWCYAIAESQNGDTILGISWMLHRDTIFDLGQRRIGMASADCPRYKEVPTSLWQRLAVTLSQLGVKPTMGPMVLGSVLVIFALFSVRLLKALPWVSREPVVSHETIFSARQVEAESLEPSDMRALLRAA